MGRPAYIYEECLAGERRSDRRYELNLELRWKLIRRRKVLETGTGRTLDISSGGILFDAGRRLASGLNIELSIAWPALLDNVAPMQLAVSGRIVRTERTRAAIRITQHEFRTAGQPVAYRGGMSAVPRFPAFVVANPPADLRKTH